jgi:hypothetical protein
MGGQNSQCLFGECILGERVLDNPEWIKVSVLGQKTWRNNQWALYQGFILASHLMPVSEFPRYNIVLQNLWTPLFTGTNFYGTSSGASIINVGFKSLPIGTRLQATKLDNHLWEVIIDNNPVGYLKVEHENDGIYEISPNIDKSQTDYFRTKITEIAQQISNQKTPYVFGGMSPTYIMLNQITGVDCSGLVRLCYLAYGLEIPRNAGPQYRAANKLSHGSELQKADLIFFANDEQVMEIRHVMIYVGSGWVIESTGFGLSSKEEAKAKGIDLKELGVRAISIKELIGTNVLDIESGKTVAQNGQYVFLGSYFAPENKIQKMRNIALGINDVW